MKRYLRTGLVATCLMTGPSLAETCSKIGVGQHSTLDLDCVLSSSFETSFGNHGLSQPEIILKHHSVEYHPTTPAESFNYEIILVDEPASRKIASDEEAFSLASGSFFSAVKTHVCQNSRAAEIILNGGGFEISVAFRSDGTAELPDPKGIFGNTAVIFDCEAP